MYLKSIEIHGFKSFANKTSFEFHNGITAIVGPNGSGKSNVADAVRWVLGEQRVKQLRGANMLDVIFSGTENRHPQSYAMVSITLDNSDHFLPVEYEELTVARRLFRSGESEYLLNGTACRLKEINELFYDTGIGKEGYSIIGQGQIDKILNGKPEDRRELFDEAAGIVKFKHRKEITQKKLEDEKASLTRISDILAEIERQLGPLEDQSAKAKEFLNKKNELRSYDINTFLLESDRIRSAIKETSDKLSDLENELSESKAEYENTKAEYLKIEEEMEVMDASAEQARDRLSKTNILKQQLEGRINVLKEQINTAQMNNDHLDNRVNTVNEEIENRNKQREEFENEGKKLEDELADVTVREQTAKQSLSSIQDEIQQLAESIDTSKNSIIKALNDRAEMTAGLQKFETIIEQSKARKGEITSKLLFLQGDKKEQDSVLTFCTEESDKLAAEINTFKASISDKEAEISLIQQKITNASDELSNKQSLYHRENSRLESLRSLTERYEGYSESIRRIMAGNTQNKGLIGVVADIIRTDKEYELAIETALGGSIQNIVVDTEDTAKTMIQYLKQNHYGRATFLPLTSVRTLSSLREANALNETGVIGTADTLVHVEERFSKLSGNLLGNILVVDTLDNAISIARKYRHTLRIVTKSGELLRPGGSMTGGAFRNSGNLLGRRREIKELEKKVSLFEKESGELSTEIDKMKAGRTSLYHDADTLNEGLHKKLLEQNTVNLNFESAKAKGLDILNSTKALQGEISDIDLSLSDIENNRTEILKQLDSSRDFEESTDKRIETVNKALDEKRLQRSKLEKQSEEVHLEAAGLIQKKDFLTENIKRINEEAVRFKNELEGLISEKGTSRGEIKQKELEIEDLHKTIDESSSIYDLLNEEIRKSIKEKEELTKRHKSFLSKREDLSMHISELDKEQFRLNSRRESNEEALEKQISYMWEEYELTYNRALELKDPALTDISALRRKTSELRNAIRDLGNVNVGSIEEYKSQKERYEFLSAQHDDIIDAQNALTKIITELDTGMRKQFEEKFEEINKEFNKVFSRLFGGGKGSLALTDEEDILEAGILIVAQPPGKKLQNIMQLSGGEKSLTAIALLFAIQNLKPSPFCLLDEIEAALDDANVRRFAEYLRLLTKNTQFIIITHRRGTMNMADRLYGITMQEKGVSALVSVDLVGDLIDKENPSDAESHKNITSA